MFRPNTGTSRTCGSSILSTAPPWRPSRTATDPGTAQTTTCQSRAIASASTRFSHLPPTHSNLRQIPRASGNSTRSSTVWAILVAVITVQAGLMYRWYLYASPHLSQRLTQSCVRPLPLCPYPQAPASSRRSARVGEENRKESSADADVALEVTPYVSCKLSDSTVSRCPTRRSRSLPPPRPCPPSRPRSLPPPGVPPRGRRRAPVLQGEAVPGSAAGLRRRPEAEFSATTRA